MVSVLSMLEPQKCSLLLALASACLFVRLTVLPACLLVGSVSRPTSPGASSQAALFYLGGLALPVGRPTPPGTQDSFKAGDSQCNHSR